MSEMSEDIAPQSSEITFLVFNLPLSNLATFLILRWLERDFKRHKTFF